MKETQIGLLIITPAIVAVALALHWKGGIGIVGTAAAIVAAVGVAAMLFLTQ